VAAPSDVVVVGAGVIGCAIGYELARRGVSVDIVDDRPAGMGATQASAGVLAPYIEAHPGTPLLDLTVRSLAAFDQFVERVRSSSGMTVPYRRSGSLEVVTTPDGRARLSALASILSSCGIAAELLDEHGARETEPELAASVLGGLLVPSHGFVGALSLTEALSAGARQHGARFVRNGRALRIGRAGRDLVVETSRVRVTGRAVVLAAGSWSGGIDIEGVSDSVPVKPIRGQLMQLSWSGQDVRRVLWGERCYLVPWDDRTVLIGATVEDVGFDERTTAAGVRDLIDAACDLVPNARAAGFTAARSGLRPATPDELPVIGPSSIVPNLMYATGHYRNGILLSPLTAQLVADALVDNRADPVLRTTSPQRFGDL
jgi:glycine oxidase